MGPSQLLCYKCSAFISARVSRCTDRCTCSACSEEKRCRFCESILDDWKPHLVSGNKVSTPYMRGKGRKLRTQLLREFTKLFPQPVSHLHAVSFNGRTHKVQVQPGEEGAKAFENEIRKMLQLPEEQEFDVSSEHLISAWERQARNKCFPMLCIPSIVCLFTT